LKSEDVGKKGGQKTIAFFQQILKF